MVAVRFVRRIYHVKKKALKMDGGFKDKVRNAAWLVPRVGEKHSKAL